MYLQMHEKRTIEIRQAATPEIRTDPVTGAIVTVILVNGIPISTIQNQASITPTTSPISVAGGSTVSSPSSVALSSTVSNPASVTSVSTPNTNLGVISTSVRPVDQPVNTNPAVSTSTGISGGAAAGIGIGGLIIGALLALLIAFILMKRSRKHPRSSRHSGSFFGNDGEKSSRGGAQPGGSVPLDETLLDRADDSQLRKCMQDLNELIDQHVENHYHSDAIAGGGGGLEKALSEAGYSSDENPTGVSEIAALLVNPRTRFLAIREVIARILVGNLLINSRAEVCLLPRQIVEFVKCFPPVERLAAADEVFGKAFTQWRHLSAFLLSPSRTNREAPTANEQDLQAAISRNVALLVSILRPFIHPDSGSQHAQEKNLGAITFEAAQLGLLLFSETSVWRFSWKVPSREGTNGESSRKRLVIFPALGEQVERHGRLRLREVSAPVVIEL